MNESFRAVTPPHAALQPPPLTMNASVKCLILGRLRRCWARLNCGYSVISTYGANSAGVAPEPAPPLGGGDAVVAVTALLAAERLPAASNALTVKV